MGKKMEKMTVTCCECLARYLFFARILDIFVVFICIERKTLRIGEFAQQFVGK